MQVCGFLEFDLNNLSLLCEERYLRTGGPLIILTGSQEGAGLLIRACSLRIANLSFRVGR